MNQFRIKEEILLLDEGFKMLGYNLSLRIFPFKFGHYLYSPRASDPNPHMLIGLFFNSLTEVLELGA